MTRAKGSGSIYQQADGWWVGSVERSRDPESGKRRRVRIVRRDRDRVVAALEELSQQRDVPRALRVGALRPPPSKDKAAVAASLETAIDTSGYVVYFLWGDDLEQPLYIGRSTNVLARLGAHLGHGTKRRSVRKVSMIRCPTEQVMCKVEERMIRIYRPPWNSVGTPVDHRARVTALRRGKLPSMDDMRDALERSERMP